MVKEKMKKEKCKREGKTRNRERGEETTRGEEDGTFLVSKIPQSSSLCLPRCKACCLMDSDY